MAMSEYRQQGEGGFAVAGGKVQGETINTDEKRAYLRRWALEIAGSDSSKLPTIREARAWVKSFFGDAQGAGMGTDVVTTELRGLRDELNSKRLGNAGRVGHIEMPTTPAEAIEAVARIAQLMKNAGLSLIAIDGDGFVTKMERFAK